MNGPPAARRDAPSDPRPPPLLPRLALAAVAGIAHGLSFSPWASGLLQVVALAVAWALVAGIGRWPAVAHARHALAIGMAFGTAGFASGLSWLYISMHDIGGLPAPLAVLAVLLLSAYLAAYGALAFWATHRLAGARPLAAAALLAVFTVIGESLRARLFTGFPWLAPGYAHVDSPLAAIAPWLGVHGITLAAVLAAGLLAAALAPGLNTARRVGALGLALLLPLLSLAAGQRSWSEPLNDPIGVRLLQGNVPQAMKFDPQRARRAMSDYIAQVGAAPADLVVLPETAWTVPLSMTPPELWLALQQAAGRAGTKVAIGAPLPVTAQQRASQPHARLTNAVATLDAQGAVLHRYDKHHLVPFGEFVPYGFRWFVDMMNIPLGDFGRGDTVQPLLHIGDTAIAFNICYEDLFGHELRTQVAAGANVLINVSNIGWFGRSHALTQHLNIARVRSMELARPMLRATNTGATAVIGADGKVTARLPYHEAGALAASVRGTRGLTPYARHGDVPVLALAALAGLATVSAVRLTTRRRR